MFIYSLSTIKLLLRSENYYTQIADEIRPKFEFM